MLCDGEDGAIYSTVFVTFSRELSSEMALPWRVLASMAGILFRMSCFWPSVLESVDGFDLMGLHLMRVFEDSDDPCTFREAATLDWLVWLAVSMFRV